MRCDTKANKPDLYCFTVSSSFYGILLYFHLVLTNISVPVNGGPRSMCPNAFRHGQECHQYCTEEDNVISIL